MDDPGSGSEAAPRAGRWSLRSILLIAALPALMGALIGTGALAKDPYAREAEEAGAEMRELPGFKERFGSVDDEDAFRVGAEIGAMAIPRLPAAELSEWLTITRQLLHALDAESCANAARGITDSDEALEAFKVLEIDVYRRYADIIMIGVRLELSDAPGALPPTQQESDAALALLVQEVGADRMQEIGTVMAAPAQASDSELCDATLDLYDALARLDEQSRVILLRMVTGQTAQAVPVRSRAVTGAIVG
jgi:hypothetical protein